MLLIYVSANNTTHRFHIAGIGRDLLSFTVNVMETTGAETVDTAMSGWFLTLAVPDVMVKNRAGFDAQLTEGTKPTVSVSVGSAESVSASGEVVPLSENLSTAIAKALKALPANQQQAVILRYFGGKTDAEIALKLGTSPGNVRVLISRALHKMEKDQSLKLEMES